MGNVEIKKGIYWVGVVDWNKRSFHGHTYTTNRGTTYNAYLIVDEKIALIDTVLGSFSDELIEKIRAIVPVEKIDYVVSNHVETDHSGALPAVMKLCPRAELYCTQKGKEGLYKNYFGDWNFRIVKTGDTLKLGKRSLTFMEAPMIHWPDSMFTYCREEELLMPNDAFGQHIATSERFDDEVDQCILMDESAKYYANILIPFGAVIARKIDEVMKMNVPISMIAPSHGIIWRKDPGKIISSYVSWANNASKKKAVIVYETMWRSTEKMALRIADGLKDSGVEVKLYDIAVSDSTEVMKDILDSKGYIIGSSTHDNDLLPSVASFLGFLRGMRPKNRVAAAFGSYGWSGGAVAAIERGLKEGGIDVVQAPISVRFVPDESEMKKCYEFGVEFAKKC